MTWWRLVVQFHSNVIKIKIYLKNIFNILGASYLIQNIIQQNKYKLFLVAYSGGMDSTVLLHYLFTIKKYNPQISIRAIHINHNVQNDSKKWQTHCVNVCKEYNIPLIIEKIDINITKNIEEQLRIKRYNLIYKNLLDKEILLTGHHLNDQCETFFLALKRGSGPTGLSAMHSETIFGKTKIIRPFLTKTKEEIKNLANLNKLKWIEDFTNFNTNYERNFIRHKILPVFEEKWPFFLKNCFRTTQICNEETTLKNILLKEKIQQYLNFNECLNISNFKCLRKELCVALIRYWIIFLKNIKKVSYKNIQCIYNKIMYNQENYNLKVIIQKNEIRCYKKFLYFVKIKKDIRNLIIFWHNTENKLKLPNNLGYIIKNNQTGINLPKPKNNALINIRFQHRGKIFIIGRHKRRNIKKIWQEHNIPPWLRNQIPLLFYNDQLISALGVFIVNQKTKNQDNEKKNQWYISWINDIRVNNGNHFLFK